MATILEHMRQLALAGTMERLADQELLRRFVQERDRTALGVLVRRHGPMVWRASRRLLHQLHDAEDVFQAAFLVLARKAASLYRHPSLAGWLHATTCRLAQRARADAARRSLHE